MATVIKAGNVASGAQVTSDATGILQFNTGSGAGTAAVTIDTSQNVGVGTASPAARLTASGTTDGSDVIRADANSNNGLIILRPDGANGNQFRYGGNGANANVLRFVQGGDTERMRIDSSGNVGISTTSPTTRFQVSGSTGNGLSYTDGTVTNYIGTSGSSIGVVGTLTNHPSLFIVNGTERMRLDTAGNLGLGVTPSAWGSGTRAFQVGSGAALYDFGSSNVAFGSNVYFDGTNNRYINSDFATYYQQNNGIHIWATAPSGTAGAQITFTQAMTLDASGNLGLGTTSPLSFGAGYAVISVNSSTGGAIAFAQSGTIKGSVFSGGNDIYIDRSNSAGNLYFRNTAAGRTDATIDSSGNFMVGFTSTTTTSCVFFRPVGEQSTTYQPIAQFGVSGTFNVSYGGRWRWYTSTGNGSVFKNGYNLQLRTFDDGSTTEATAATVTYQTWFQGNNSASWSTTSDERVKTNIRPISNALSKICALKPCHFEMKNEIGVTKTNFIAQEFEQVFPGHVSEVTTPDEYKEFTDSSTIKAVDVNLIPYLTAAIQELTAKVEAQAAELAALKGAA